MQLKGQEETEDHFRYKWIPRISEILGFFVLDCCDFYSVAL